MFDTMLQDPQQDFRLRSKQHRPRIVVVYEDNFNFLSKMCLTRMREVAYRDSRRIAASRRDGAGQRLRRLRPQSRLPAKGFHCVLLGEAEWTLLGSWSRICC